MTRNSVIKITRMMYDIIKKDGRSFTWVLRKIADETTQKTTDEKLVDIIKNFK